MTADLVCQTYHRGLRGEPPRNTVTCPDIFLRKNGVHMLQFSIQNQTIKRTDNYRPVAGQSCAIHFDFVTDDWQALNKKAVFRISGSDTPYIRDLYITDSCDVPDELLLGNESRFIELFILGSGTDDRGRSVKVTTAPVKVFIAPSGSEDSNHG